MNIRAPAFAQALARGVKQMASSLGSFGTISGGGSGMWEGTALTAQQKGRSLTLQDTMRSHDLLTWRKGLAYSRQLWTNYGEIRGPLIERALLSNAGIWTPRCIGKNTPKKVRDAYEEYLWEWFKVCDLRRHPFDFWTDMLLASIMLDRDGEPPMLKTKNENGDPRIQWLPNHRIYSRVGVQWVPDGPYKGMRMNNGVIYDDQSCPVAYRVLQPSLQFAQALKYDDLPASSFYVTYNPDWCDQGRGMGAIMHAIRRAYDIGEIYDAQLTAIKRDSKIPVVVNNDTGSADDGEQHLHGGSANGGEEEFTDEHGDPIVFEDLQDGELWYVRANAGNKIEIPNSDRPSPNVPGFVEVIIRGLYQGIPWPYAFTRSAKESGGADYRGGVIELVNVVIGAQFGRLHRIAHHAATYALAVEVDRKNLPPGEWWALEFPAPPRLTADRWRQYQEDRENFMLGHDTLQRIAASRGQHWVDIRNQRDVEIDDVLTRCEAHSQKHNWLKPREVFEIFEQRSPNPSVQKDPAEKQSKKDNEDQE